MALTARSFMCKQLAGPLGRFGAAASWTSAAMPTQFARSLSTAPVRKIGASKRHEFYKLAQTLKLARNVQANVECKASVEVAFNIIADLEGYSKWMPWCSAGKGHPMLKGLTTASVSKEEVFNGNVTFGYNTGTALGHVGDTVKYKVSICRPEAGEPGRVVADAADGFSYANRLIYDWRFTQVDEKNTKVSLHMLYQANRMLYLPFFDQLHRGVTDEMLKAFIVHAEKLERHSRT